MKNSESGTEKKGRYIVNILGVDVVSSLTSSLLKQFEQIINKKVFVKPFFVITANPEILMLGQNDGEYQKILNSADLVIADGMGLKLAGIKDVTPGRVLAGELLSKKLKIFFLGGKNQVAREMAIKYGGKWDDGHKNIRIDPIDLITNERIINKINKCKPDVLLVAYGSPWQEKWIAENLSKLQAKVVMGVGGAFDYLTGRTKIPPDFINKAGLEWAWRLWHEPWRWKRQLALVKFIFFLGREKLIKYF